MRQSKKRALLAITGAFHTIGGIAAVNRLVIHALNDASYSMDILALLESSPQIDARYVDPDRVRQVVFHSNKLRFVGQVWQQLVANKYDLVITDLANLAAGLAPLAILGRCRYVTWMYGADVFPPRPDFEGRLGLKYAWRRLAISSFTRESMLRRYPGMDIRLCELCLDPVMHDTSAGQIGNGLESLTAINGQSQSLNGHVILHVARMDASQRAKGHESLLRAFPKIVSTIPDTQLVLVGGGDDRERLMTLANSLPEDIHKQIFFPGFVSEALLNRLYEICFAFVMPSQREGFGLVYLEAMRHGKPCIGGGKDASGTVIREGKTGLLFHDPSSPESVAEKTIQLLTHPEKAVAMGRAGRELVYSYYLFPHFVQRFWRAINID